MTHPLDGLLTAVKKGDLSQIAELRDLSDLDLTASVRRALLAECIADGKFPHAGSDEANFLITLLSQIDRQVIEKERNSIESKKTDIGASIKEILLSNPGRLGSAQEIAKKIGGDPDENSQPTVDRSKFDGFEFTPSELSNESHGLSLNNVNDIVKNYQEKVVASASEANKIVEEESQDKKSQNS